MNSGIKYSKLKTGRNVIDACERQEGWTVRRNGGSHVMVENPEGLSVCVPDHGELHKGIKVKIIKRLLVMGLPIVGILLFYITNVP